MNKTVTINLSGQVFQIDEDAYEKLKAYLDSIYARFSGTEGADEIMADIEARLAEMFAASMGDKKNVVSIADVDQVMQVMGKPEDFGDVDSDEETSGSSAYSKQTTAGPKVKRKLYRDGDDKILGGVLSGLSAYMGVSDPVWLRLATATILLFASGGTIVLLYIIMWIIVPKAVTASEKLEMKGEPINIDNIERTIREDIEDIKGRFHHMDSHSAREKVRTGLARIAGLLLHIFWFLLRFMGGVIGFAIIVAALSMFIALIWFPGHLSNYSYDLLPYYFSNQTQVTLAIISFILVVFIPLLALLALGFRLMFFRRFHGRGLGFSFTGLFILGIILAFICGTYHFSDLADSNVTTVRMPITIPANSTLHVKLMNGKDAGAEPYYSFLNIGPLKIAGDSIYLSGNSQSETVEFVSLGIKKSDSKECYLEKIIFARGKNRNEALEKVSHVAYNLKLEDSTLYLADYLSFPKNDKIRGQMVRLTLYIPQGDSVKLDESACKILSGAQNTNGYYPYIMAGHTWTMGPEALTCMNCEDVNKSRMHLFGEGKQITPGDFDKVEVNGVFEVHLHKGDKSMVQLYGPDDVVRNVEVRTDDNTLSISSNRHWLDQLKHLRPGNYRIYIDVTTAKLEKLEAAGACNVEVKGFTGNELSVDISGASHADVDVKTDELTVDGSGASDVTLSGSCRILNSEMSGASALNAFNFNAREATIAATGASHSKVKVTEKLNATASGASEVMYEGSPTISSDASGFSSIKPRH